MRRLVAVVTALAFLWFNADAAWADFVFTQGTGTTSVGFDSTHSGTSRCAASNTVCFGFVPMDTTGTFLFGSGNAGYVQFPSAQSVSQSGTWNITNISGTVSLPTGASTAANQTATQPRNVSQFGGNNVVTGTGASGVGIPRVTVSNDSTVTANAGTGNFTVVNGGTFAVQATLQASATTAIGKVDPNTIGNWGLVTSTQNSATPTNGALIEGQFNTSPTTITSGNVSPLQLDSAGNLLVNIKAGAGSGGTALADGATFTIGTTNETPMGCTYVSGGITVTTGKASVVTCTAAGSLHTTVDNTNANGQTTMSASSPVVLASNQALPWTGSTAATAPTSASLTGAIGVTADQTAVTNGQMVAPEATPNGKLIVQPWAITPNLANGGGSSTGTGTFTILAASGSASLKEYVTGVQCGRSDAGTTAVTVAISDGTTTRTLVVPNNGGGGGNNAQFVTPVAYAANTAVTAAFSTGVTTGYCNAEGFYAP